MFITFGSIEVGFQIPSEQYCKTIIDGHIISEKQAHPSIIYGIFEDDNNTFVYPMTISNKQGDYSIFFEHKFASYDDFKKYLESFKKFFHDEVKRIVNLSKSYSVVSDVMAPIRDFQSNLAELGQSLISLDAFLSIQANIGKPKPEYFDHVDFLDYIDT